MAQYTEDFLREFFELYKEQECLWKIKSDAYHDRNARKRAMTVLVTKFREVNEAANEEFVKKKINNFRTSYKRELKLVQNSSKSGAGSEDVYKPKLWYFVLLSFLSDQVSPRRSVSNISDEEEIEDEENETELVLSPMSPLALQNEESELSQDLSQLPSTSSYAKTPSLKKKRPRKSMDPRDELLVTINEKLQQPIPNVREKDKFDIFCDNVAVKLRGLENNQRIMAEKFINDVLYEAESNNLSRGWVLQPPSSNIPSSIAYNNTGIGEIRENYYGGSSTDNNNFNQLQEYVGNINNINSQPYNLSASHPNSTNNE